MSILIRDLKLYGSASMPDDDTPVDIGGAIDTSKKPAFSDVNGTVQAVSDSAADTTQTLTITYRDSTGTIQTEAQTLTGKTPVMYAATMERLLKGVLSVAAASGNVALEAQSAERSNTAQGGDADSVTLDSGANGSDDYYNGMIIRLTAGPASGDVREIVDYEGTAKKAWVSAALSGTPTSGTDFRIAKGFFFDLTPATVTEVRRLFYDAAADPPGGSDFKYYDKVFAKNVHGSLTLNAAMVKESADPSTLVAFGVAAAKDDTGGNGGGNNRKVAPGAITFNSSDKAVPTGSLAAGETIGVWLELTLDAGAAAQKTTYTLRLTGTTV